MVVRTPTEIWETALGEIQIEVSKTNFQTWFKKTTGHSYLENNFTIGVPNTFVGEYLDKNQSSLISRVLTGILQTKVGLGFYVNGHHEDLTNKSSLPLFNPKYTFDNFVVGRSNDLAYAAASKVAENPGQNFNPLVIHGGSGLGKTHLLQAIGQKASMDDLNVLCVSAEQYTNELVTSIREKNTGAFRKKYRSVDMLLMDDVQFLSGKEQTEESFFHTFNELHGNNRQVVLTSDRSPRAISGMKERLKSRLEGGLVVDLQTPDFDTRLSVLKAKAEKDGMDLSPDVLEFIALQIKENMRSLEGSLNRVIAYSKLLKAAVTPEVAACAIDNLASKQPQLAPVTPSIITETVAGLFQINISDIKGRRRDGNTVLARQVCMYLMREETDYSLNDIGKELGGRSAATISYAYEKMGTAINNDPQLRRRVFNVQQQLHPNCSANL